MALGHAPPSEDLVSSAALFCKDGLAASSIYRLLHEDCHRLFPDEDFADLFENRGRRCIPPRVVAVGMVLQRLEGLSDREAVERFAFDLRCKYASGVPLDYPAFVHTVLVNMRMRLLHSDKPDRVFDAVLEVAEQAGLVGKRRVLDATAIYDAVTTMDTVTLLRSALRALLKVADDELEEALRAVLCRDDDDVDAGKPTCDWDDKVAGKELVDALARDGYAALRVLHGRRLCSDVESASELLATLLGQDLEQGDDGAFLIARKVAKDRILSTVDPDARHGHKTSSRKFDGYKGHIAIDPDSEILTNTAVTAGNVGDAEVAEALVGDVLGPQPAGEPVDRLADAEAPSPTHEGVNSVTDATAPLPPDVGAAARNEKQGRQAAPQGAQPVDNEVVTGSTEAASAHTPSMQPKPCAPEAAPPPAAPTEADEPVEIYGDSSYGTAKFVEVIEEADAAVFVKMQPPVNQKGRYAKQAFNVDTEANEVTCPAGITVPIRHRADGSGRARFRNNCAECPLRSKCTESKRGRIINVHAKEETLQRTRAAQKSPHWRKGYREVRPKVERKFGHMMRRRHGGRRARVRGKQRVEQDFALLGAAINLQRLAKLGIRAPQRAQKAAGTKCHTLG